MYWTGLTLLGVATASPLLALALLVSGRLRQAVPWLGLTTVLGGTVLAFSSSATLVERGATGFGAGWLVTAIYGLVGLGIVVGFVRLRPAPLIPVACVVAGLIYVASFYAFLWGLDLRMLVLLAPGIGLVTFGSLLAQRHGLNGTSHAGASG